MGVKKYPEALEFILHWGEMGTHWGANRSVAQVHALLFLSDRPLDAEAICEALDLARSNVSNALKELQGYGIVKRTHMSGDRRDHFVAETELWMHEFMATLTTWYEQVRGLKKSTLVSLMKMGAKVARFIPGSTKD
jgi:DNA-binding transcriptional regulator GbsR (MarR family)